MEKDVVVNDRIWENKLAFLAFRISVLQIDSFLDEIDSSQETENWEIVLGERKNIICFELISIINKLKLINGMITLQWGLLENKKLIEIIYKYNSNLYDLLILWLEKLENSPDNTVYFSEKSVAELENYLGGMVIKIDRIIDNLDLTNDLDLRIQELTPILKSISSGIDAIVTGCLVIKHRS